MCVCVFKVTEGNSHRGLEQKCLEFTLASSAGTCPLPFFLMMFLVEWSLTRTADCSGLRGPENGFMGNDPGKHRVRLIMDAAKERGFGPEHFWKNTG